MKTKEKDESADSAQIIDFIEDNNLDYTVEKIPLRTPEGVESGYYATRKKGNYDKDNAGDLFGVFGEGYSVLQNDELVSLCFTLCGEFDLIAEKGRTYNRGRKVAIDLYNGSEKNIGPGNDTIKRYITAVNSFDGSTSLAFGATNIIQDGKLLFFSTGKHLQSRMKHTSGMLAKVEYASKQIAELQESEKQFYTKLKFLPTIRLRAENMGEVMRLITGVNVKNADWKEETSQQKINQVDLVRTLIKEELKKRGNTLYGLFCGCLKYTTYHIGVSKRKNARMESKIFSRAGIIDNKVWDYISKQI